MQTQEEGFGLASSNGDHNGIIRVTADNIFEVYDNDTDTDTNTLASAQFEKIEIGNEETKTTINIDGSITLAPNAKIFHTTITESFYNVILFSSAAEKMHCNGNMQQTKHIELQKINTTINHFVAANTANPRE